MKKQSIHVKNLYSEELLQYSAFFGLSLCVFVLTLVLYFFDSTPFKRFIGNMNPILAIAISFILGLFLLSYLITNTSLILYRKKSIKDYFIISAIAIVFGIEVIAADIWLVNYSADINILFPHSLLFYPVIGYIVEVFFHIIPITIIIIFLTVFKRIHPNKIIWISIVSVALLEPLYQVWFTSQNSQLTSIYTGLHVFLISITQLIIFKYYDFISMYFFRLVFYSIWHILWGHLRLSLLFNH